MEEEKKLTPAEQKAKDKKEMDALIAGLTIIVVWAAINVVLICLIVLPYLSPYMSTEPLTRETAVWTVYFMGTMMAMMAEALAAAVAVMVIWLWVKYPIAMLIMTIAIAVAAYFVFWYCGC